MADPVGSTSWRDYALLMVDFQRDFYPEDVAQRHPALPADTATLLEAARERGIDVVHLNARFAPDGSDWIARYRLRGRIPCIDGTEGAEPLDFAAPLAGETVVVKQSFDGFLNTGLHDLLTERGIRFVLVAGLVTSTCVLFTATSATQLGYLVAVVEDCCGDLPGAHSRTLDAYPFVFGRTTSGELDQARAGWDAQLVALDQPVTPVR